MRSARAASRTPESDGSPGRSTPKETVGRSCPIPGCRHIFKVGRLGWDAHVASLKIHPDWHPEVTDPAERNGSSAGIPGVLQGLMATSALIGRAASSLCPVFPRSGSAVAKRTAGRVAPMLCQMSNSFRNEFDQKNV